MYQQWKDVLCELREYRHKKICCWASSFVLPSPVERKKKNIFNFHVVLLLLCQVLSPSNMHTRFSTLLWLEELNAESEMREFTINGALLRKGAVYLHLEVPGLSEGRPNISIGEVDIRDPLHCW